MSLARWSNTRDTNEHAIISALEQVGATVEKIDTGGGVPDLLVGYRALNFLLEVKHPKTPLGGTSHSKLSESQIEFHRTWKGQVDIVRCELDALKAIGAVRQNGSRDA